MNMLVRQLVIPLGLVALIFPSQARAAEEATEVKQALERAGANRAELVRALQQAPAEQAKGMAFLIANMPDADLRSLKADFLLENVRLAYEARRQVPWGARIPEDVFLNDVLPYANVDESRHPWRKELFDLCLPLVKDCKTPAEAAQRLNETIYKKLKVRYSTQRLKAEQSPQETIAGGTATCTGLSILLSDACRSVAVPARLAGTPLWMNKRGNHTWVEIWDGRWHFTGACEPDARGLDHGWFENDAAQAQKDSIVHAIYAASFRKTDIKFPLVWAPKSKFVSAENVTDRYARSETKKGDTARIMIRVWDAGRTRRLAVPVTVVDRQDAGRVWRGESRGDTADANNLLTFDLPAGRSYSVRVDKPARLEQQFTVAATKQQVIEVEIPAASKTGKASLSEALAEQITRAAAAFFAASPEAQAHWRFDAHLDALLRADEAAVRQAVWKAYQEAPIHAAAKQDYDHHQVRYLSHLSPYTIKTVGKRPEHGWPLFIALHGGGGAPKAVNDSQWKHMQIYYRDQKDVPGYLYVALRAPNDTWNGFYDDYVPPLIINLIRQFLLFGDVNPDKVYVMGYSHGGYGAFWIGPKIPDRFAAVHCSASAPTDGSISPRSLRNTRFTFMVGENDNAYGRRKRCEAFAEAINQLKKQDPDGYPVEIELKKGFGHGGLPDRDKIKDLYLFTRNPVHTRLYWDLTDSVITHFYWLSVPQPGKGQTIEATIRDNTVRITTHDVKRFMLSLDGRLVDFDHPLQMEVNGRKQELRPQPRFLNLCQSLMERGDPQLAFTVRIELPAGEKPAKATRKISPEEIDRLIKELGDDQFATRIQARKQLETIGEPAIPALKKVLENTNDPEIRSAARALVEAYEQKESGILRVFAGHGDRVNGVAISRDGKRALSASWDGGLRYWDLEKGTLLRQMRGPGPLNSVVLSADGKRALTGSVQVSLWDVESGKLLRLFTGRNNLAGFWDVAFSPDGRKALAAGGDGVARLWDLDSGQELLALGTPSGHRLWTVAFTPDGKQAVTGGPTQEVNGLTDAFVQLWDLTTGKEIRQFRGHTADIRRVTVSRDGKRLLTASFDGTMRLWDMQTGDELKCCKGPGNFVEAVAFLPDGKRALCCYGPQVLGGADTDARRNLCVWDLTSGKELKQFRGHDGAVLSLALSGDGRFLVSGSADNTMRLWQVAK